MSIFRLNRVHWPAVKLAETLSFHAKLLLAMMLVVLAVLVATLYLTERNLRANQEKVLEIQYQNQVRSFLAGQEVQSRAIEQRCSALARSVRLRAALEERDEDDLYRNALTELQGIFGGPD